MTHKGQNFWDTKSIMRICFYKNVIIDSQNVSHNWIFLLLWQCFIILTFNIFVIIGIYQNMHYP